MATVTKSYAFISDIHSNLEALEAVLDDIGGTEVYCLGDIVGYGASPNEVIALLREKGATCIIGNHDFAVLSGRVNEFNSRAVQAVTWTIRTLTEESRLFLEGLPQSRTTTLQGQKVYVTHGSPDDNLWEYVFPATHSDLLGFYLERLRVQVIALGHTHVPFIWVDRPGTVFNPGSVGQPRAGDRRASYALLKVGANGVAVEHRNVEYDVETAARKIVEVGLPDSLARRLFTGG
ncbi:MAG: metallophosphatase family protein [Thaumarchaeota archaeon]|nr:metallophosphatase family protein [Nitrososphaerota archaeon]